MKDAMEEPLAIEDRVVIHTNDGLKSATVKSVTGNRFVIVSCDDGTERVIANPKQIIRTEK